MDNLTHALTGLMMSRAGLGKYCPRAGALMMFAANAPDLDILYVFSSDSATYLSQHRAITHGVAAAPIMALAPMLVIGLIDRRNFPWWKAYLLSLLGVLSHLLLDWTNIYGIRLALPFSGEWFRLDFTSVIDIWIWGVLAVAFLWPMLARLVTSEIGARSKAGAGIARFALLFLLLYNCGRGVLHSRAVATMEARLHAGENPIRTAALPYLANPFRWSGIAQIHNGFVLHEINLLGEFDPSAGSVYYNDDPSPALEIARKTRVFQIFLGFAAFPLWSVERLPEPEGALRVDATELRFNSDPVERRFTATAIIDSSGKVIESYFRYEQPGQPIRLR